MSKFVQVDDVIAFVLWLKVCGTWLWQLWLFCLLASSVLIVAISSAIDYYSGFLNYVGIASRKQSLRATLSGRSLDICGPCAMCLIGLVVALIA